MAYVNFKEERQVTKEQLKKRRTNNEKLFNKLMESKDLPKCYNPDKEYSYRGFIEKHFGGGRIQDEEDYEVIVNKDIICTIFDNCTFGNLKFENCNFIGCRFENCKFESGGVIFKNCCFYKEESEKKPSLNRRDNFSCEFRNCEIYAKFDSCTISYCIFSRCFIENTYFLLSDMTSLITVDSEIKTIRIEDCDLSGAKLMSTYVIDLDFTDKVKTKLDEKTFFDKIEYRNKDRAEYEGIYMTYETIANKFKENNLNNNFGEYYYLCKETQRKTLKIIPKIYSFFYWATCGYGERPTYSIIFALSIILIFAILYLLFGVKIDGNIISYLDYKVYNNSIIYHLMNFHKGITLSCGMFSGVGANNIEPIRFSEFISNVEMLIGLIIIGIGVGTVTRKIVR